MIGIIARVGAVVMASIIAPAHGDQIKVEDGAWRNTLNGGGEFKITTLSGFAGVNGLASDEPGTFQTFCLEIGSAINTGPGSSGTANVYDYTLGNAAVPGGPGASDPVGFETAYLYTQFRMGVLSDYAFNGTAEDRKASAAALQSALWYLEGEISLVSGQAADWVAQAQAAVAPGGSWGETLGLVRVLVLSQGGNDRQDVLTLVPLPAAAWVGLAGLAAIPVIRARRRVP
jgi:hypothetical protein